MNQLNLKNLTGKVIKQGDFESPFRFELQDFNYKPVTKHDGLEATIKIGKGSEIIYQTTSTVQNSIVEFEFENAIPVGIYRVEITVGESVYPSDNNIWLTVESSMTEYAPQEVYRVVELTKDELRGLLSGDISAYDDTEIKRRIAELENNPVDISSINERLETLENKVDKDAIYDDSALAERIQALEERADNDAVYDDTELKERLEKLENKPSEAYDDTNLTQRVQELESKPEVDLSDYAKRSELSTFDNSENERRLTELENKPSGSAEVKDTGWISIGEAMKNAESRLSECESFVRRVGDNVFFEVTAGKGTVSTAEINMGFPDGFKTVWTGYRGSPGYSPHIAEFIGNGRLRLQGVVANGSSVWAVRHQYTTMDPFPDDMIGIGKWTR